MKSVKIFQHTSILEIGHHRELFTTHGLHLNCLGEEMLSEKILPRLYNTAEKKENSPVSLGWKNGTTTSVMENNTDNINTKKVSN